MWKGTSIPVDITSRPPGSQNTHSPEAAHIGILLSIKLESTEANLHMTQIICSYSTLHTTYYARLTRTHPHHSICHNVGPRSHFSACVSACINVFDPDINCVGTKLSSLPLMDVKMSLITARTCCEII